MTTPVPTAAVPHQFEPQELVQFEADDRYAGRFLGGLLAAFFAFLVILMACVGWWTHANQAQLTDAQSTVAH